MAAAASPPPPPGPRFYTLRQAGEHLQMSYKQVWISVQNQHIRAVRIGRHWRIPDHELDRLARCAAGPNGADSAT